MTANLAATRVGTDLAIANLAFEADTTPQQSTTLGATMLRNKLVQLHQVLLGQTVAADAPEINALYDLLVQTWDEKRNSTLAKNLYQQDISCTEWTTDPGYADYVGFPGKARILNSDGLGNQSYSYDFPLVNPWMRAMGSDVLYMKQTWVVIMGYYLTHYNYLYE
jgi:hypothetical protein